jgi:hypothetical protein
LLLHARAEPSFEPELFELTALRGFNHVPPDYDDLKYRIPSPQLEARWAELRFDWLFSVLLMANIICGQSEHVCFLAWQFRLRSNAAALGATVCRHPPGRLPSAVVRSACRFAESRTRGA